jgi:hypothetical protein
VIAKIISAGIGDRPSAAIPGTTVTKTVTVTKKKVSRFGLTFS